MEVAARRAVPLDRAIIGQLAAAFRDEQRLGRGGGLWAEREAPALDDSIATAAHDNDTRCWIVGTIDDVVIAYALVETEVIRDGARLGRIEELFVDEQARTVGVGEAMMEMAIAWCKDHRCTGIDAYALPGERLTKNFFESNGFVARLLTMHHRFDRSSESAG